MTRNIANMLTSKMPLQKTINNEPSSRRIRDKLRLFPPREFFEHVSRFGLVREDAKRKLKQSRFSVGGQGTHVSPRPVEVCRVKRRVIRSSSEIPEVHRVFPRHVVQHVSNLVVCGPRLRVLFEGRHLLENLVVSIFRSRQVQHLLDAGLGGALWDALDQIRDCPALWSRHGFDVWVLALMGGVRWEVPPGVW